MVLLPSQFLEWNYFPRRRLLENMLTGKMDDPEKFFLEFTRHNPALITGAYVDGRVIVNGKIVGCGYVLKEEYLDEAIEAFREHIDKSDRLYEKVKGDKKALRELYEEHAKRGAELLLKYIYLPRDCAHKVVDFEKLATVELAKRIPWSAKHTWKIVQLNMSASLLFFQPPAISFEIKGHLTIHVDDRYHCFVTLVHDAYHYTPPEHRSDRPVYILHVEEVFDKSATNSGFGRKIA